MSDKRNTMAPKLLCGVPILSVSMASPHVSKASRIKGEVDLFMISHEKEIVNNIMRRRQTENNTTVLMENIQEPSNYSI